MYGRMISCNVSGPLAADHAWRTQQFFCLPGAVGQLQLIILPTSTPPAEGRPSRSAPTSALASASELFIFQFPTT